MPVAEGIFEVKYGTEKHRFILDAVKSRLALSRNAMSNRYEQWRQNEEQYMAYMKTTTADQTRKSVRSTGRPQYTTIDIPYSYATLMTAHTYYSSVFLARAPILQYSGRHGETQQQEQGVEALMSYQIETGGNLVPLYIWLLDPGKYGIGVLGMYWDEEDITVSKFADVVPTFLGQPIPFAKPKRERITQSAKGYVGNRFYNVRPADFFPDPRLPVSQFQKGEFVARYVEIGWADFLDRYEDGVYFNREYVGKGRILQAGLQRDTGSSQNTLPNTAPLVPETAVLYNPNDVGFVPIHEVYVKLRPSEWKLGDSSKREIWVFTIANEEVIVSAQPLALLHGKYPFSVLEAEIEGYNLFKRSYLETIKPLADTLTWLVNTHFYNIRKTLNGEFIVDPSKLYMKDIDDPNPGRLVRLKPTAYGVDVRTVLSQLQSVDVTGQHIRDAQLVAEMIQRVGGVTDNVMGMVNSAGRKTATEVRTSSSFSVNRLKTTCEYFSAMGFSPMSMMALQTSQQMYDMNRGLKIVGSMARWGTDRYLQVSPELIQGFYDFVPVDGTMPIDRFAQANMWGTLLGQVRNFPQIMQQYDMAKIFAFVAQLAGIKNIEQFRVNIVPDGSMAGQVQAGNVIPLKGAPGTPSAGTPAVGGKQVANVGPSG